MGDSQDFSKRKQPLKNIATVEQLVASYYVAKAINEIRKNREEFLKNKAKSFVDKPDVKDRELIEMFDEFSELISYKPGFLIIAKTAIEDIERYNFEEDPSVVTLQPNDTKHLQKKFGSDYATLSSITLKDHTKRVFKNGLKIGKSKGRAMQIAIPILGCLLHDFGKSSLIRKEIFGGNVTSGYRPHAEVSGSYVKEILFKELTKKYGDMVHDSTISTLANIVELHHPSTNKQKSSEMIRFISEADQIARNQEYKKLQSLQR